MRSHRPEDWRALLISAIVLAATASGLVLTQAFSAPSTRPLGSLPNDITTGWLTGTYHSNFSVPIAGSWTYLVGVLVTMRFQNIDQPPCNTLNFALNPPPAPSCTFWVNTTNDTEQPTTIPEPSQVFWSSPFASVYTLRESFYSSGGNYTFAVLCYLPGPTQKSPPSPENFSLNGSVQIIAQVQSVW